MAKYLLAVSGGPDSMFLLNQYKNRNIVVAHVNYHKRESANRDEKLVRQFCLNHNLKLFVKNVKEQSRGNFQAWARTVRYKFFAEIYHQEKCTELLVAHHKDDFLESGMMQLESKRITRQFGIAENSVVHGMQVKRPLLHHYWKQDLIKILDKKQIAYGTDETNEKPIYARNAIRQTIAKMPKQEKRSRYDWLIMSNRILKKKYRKIDALYNKWKNTQFARAFFCQLNHFREELIYELLAQNFENFKISSEKLKSCETFICKSDAGKKYNLGKNNFLLKTRTHIELIKKNN